MRSKAKTYLSLSSLLIIVVFCWLPAVVFYFAGSNKYSDLQIINLLQYIFILYFAFIIGYIVLLPSMKKAANKCHVKDFSFFPLIPSIRILFFISCILSIFLFSFDILRLLTNFDNYIFKLLEATSIVLMPAKKIYLPLGLLFWQQFDIKTKSLFFVTFIIQFLFSLLMGTQTLLEEILFPLIVYLLYFIFIQNTAFTKATKLAPYSVLKHWKKKRHIAIIILFILTLTILITMNEPLGFGISSMKNPISNESTVYNSLDNWRSPLFWWTSDLSLVGTIVLMFLFGIASAFAWKKLTLDRNPIALVFIVLLFSEFNMVVANYQLFQTLENLIATTAITVIFLFSLKQNFKVIKKAKPRFTFISGSYDFGGASKMLSLFIQYCNKKGIATKLIVSNCIQKDIKNLKNTEIVHMKQIPNIIKRIIFLGKNIKGNQPEVFLPFVTAMIINSYPFIRNRPNCGFDRGNLARLPTKYKFFAKFIYPRYFSIVFQSTAARDSLEFSSRVKSIVITNPFMPAGKDPGVYNGIRNKRIVTVSRLSTEKRILNVILAFNQSKALNENYILEIYGSGPEREHLQDLIDKLDLRARVFLRGATTEPMVAIKDAAMFILASDNEGMPNALTEAMALGIPSIATNCMPGDTNLLIQNGINGLVVEKNNVNSIIEAINSFVENKRYAENLGKKGAEVREIYSVENFERETDILINNLNEVAEYVW